MARLSKQVLLPVIAVLALVLLVFVMAGGFRNKVAPGIQSNPPVQVDQQWTAQLLEDVVVEPVAATIQARQATLISSRILARIKQVNVRAGDMVEKGTVVVELEQKDLATRVSQAKGRLDSVSALLKEAGQSLKRTAELRDKGVLSLSDFDKAKARYDSLLAEKSSAEQGLKEAQTIQAYSRIESPIAGRVVDRFAEPGDTAQPGQKLLSIYNPLSLRVEAYVREKLALRLQSGQALQVEVAAVDKKFPAEIEEIVPVSAPGSRSFLVKCRIDYADKLLPGMFARLLIPAGTVSRVVVPADYVGRVGQLEIVWVLEDGQVRKRFVRTGKMLADDQVEIVSGLQVGEVIVNPLTN
jgi:RND family efflux transporter MFP subunit